MKKCTAFILCFIFSLLFLPAAWSQDLSQALSSVDSDLQLLENLIADTLLNTQEQQRLLEDLRTDLYDSSTLISSYESIINGQENLLRDLRTHLHEMSETYRMQSALSAKYEKSSKFWRNFTLTAIPVTAILSGTIVWAIVK